MASRRVRGESLPCGPWVVLRVVPWWRGEFDCAPGLGRRGDRKREMAFLFIILFFRTCKIKINLTIAILLLEITLIRIFRFGKFYLNWRFHQKLN